jgi:molybdopterin synthase sulfur carrier subunit
MGVVVRIPQPLQKLTNGQAEVSGEGASARELIAHLEGKYGGIRNRLLDDAGKLRRFVIIYKNDEDIRFLQDLDTPLTDGDTVSIVPAIAGGVTLGDPTNVKKKFYLTFPQTLIKRPVIWELMKEFDVIANIRQASISNDIGLVALEIEGSQPQVDASRDWLEALGVIVEPVEKNVIE